MLRFKVGDVVQCNCQDGWVAGEVVALNYTAPLPEASAQQATPTTYSYRVLDADGRDMLVPFDGDNAIKEFKGTFQKYKEYTGASDVLRFALGDNVTCWCGPPAGWKYGSIEKIHTSHPNVLDGKPLPYQIKLADGTSIYAPSDTIDVVRELKVYTPGMPLRFKMGQQVECSYNDKWVIGTISQLRYQDATKNVLQGNEAPYAIDLLPPIGETIVTPIDDDTVVRTYTGTKTSNHPPAQELQENDAGGAAKTAQELQENDAAGAAKKDASPFIGSTVSLISESQLRYEGVLTAVDQQEATVSLQDVQLYGTEGRKGGQNEIPSNTTVYSLIKFRANQILELRILDQSPTPIVDPAILAATESPTAQQPTPIGSNSSDAPPPPTATPTPPATATSNASPRPSSPSAKDARRPNVNWPQNMFKYLTATYHILAFYFHFIFQFSRIHKDLPSGRLLREIAAKSAATTQPINITLDYSFSQHFNQQYHALRQRLRAMLNPSTSIKFETVLFSSWLVRMLWCLGVWTHGIKALPLGLLQFVVAPMSFAVCILRFGTNAFDAVMHYTINGCVGYALSQSYGSSGPSTHGWCFTISTAFVLSFFIVDFLLNLFVYAQVSDTFHAKRLLKHIVYGTFNTKTYFLVVLGCVYQQKVDIVHFLLTGTITLCITRFTGLKATIWSMLGLPCFSILFYVEHRIGHCPVVYTHAHKMHHYLHDTTSFDAHIYGSGMNEEFFWVLAEILPCVWCPSLFFPYFLNLETLYMSWQNKGAHTRTSKSAGRNTFGDYDFSNWHADHHTYHVSCSNRCSNRCSHTSGKSLCTI